MHLLLDTHILLWTLLEPYKLSRTVRDYLDGDNHVVHFSAASIWELSIKAGLGRTNFRATPRQIHASALHADFVELPITAAATLGVADLPMHHRDPFDRLLIAQARLLGARLCTVDRRMRLYGDVVDIA